jgi:hypothetical protein
VTQEQAAAQDAHSQAEVDIGNAEAVRRWADALGVTDEALVSAVHAVGARVDLIKEYLGAGGMAADQEDG